MACSRRPTPGRALRARAPCDFGGGCASRCTRLSGAPARGRQRRSLGPRGPASGAGATWPSKPAPTLVLLAHHRRDQAETFLLQALRGAGPAGLAAMPQARCATASPGPGPGWTQPRAAIEAYAEQHRLRLDRRREQRRSALRPQPAAADVWPARRRFPAAEAGLGPGGALGPAGRRRWLPRWRRRTWPVGDAERWTSSRWQRCRPPERSNALRAWLARTAARRRPAWSSVCWPSGGPADGVLARARWRRCTPIATACRCGRAAPMPRHRHRPSTLSRPGLHAPTRAGTAPGWSSPRHRGIATGAAWHGWPVRPRRRRAVPGGRRPAAAQPEEAIPGSRRAAWRARRPAAFRVATPWSFVPGLGWTPRACRRKASRSSLCAGWTRQPCCMAKATTRCR